MNRDYLKRPLQILSWFCPQNLYEGIAGDLQEQFEIDCREMGVNEARKKLNWGIVKFFRPSILLRNRFSAGFNPTFMLKNYAMVASRNLMKRKTYSFINGFGLSIGIAFCILIYLFILDEKSFDQFHENKLSIYRIENKTLNTWDASPDNLYNVHAWSQTPLLEALKDEFPEVVYATRFNPDHAALFRYDGKVFNENITFVDNDFFQMFSFPLIAGSAKKLLLDKYEVVLTPEIVTKYFGTEDPIGKTIILDVSGEKSLTVTGIINAPPANSSLDFKILVSQLLRPGYEHSLTQWTSWNTPTFVQLADGTNLKAFSKNLDKVVDKHLSENVKKWREESTIAVPEDATIFEYVYTQLPDVHLKTEVGWTRVSDSQYSWILGGIALLILFIACINYISLALTTSASRRTEVGIRKVAGALKRQLIYQFGFESILLAIISLFAGMGLVLLFLPSFNDFTGKNIAVNVSDLVTIIPFSLGMTVLVGLIAGSYPAWFLSGFRPAIVLKGRFTSKLHAGFTKPLVVIQFSLAAFLIISSLIMYKQMKYITTKDLGFAKDQIVVIPTQAGWNDASDKVVTRYRNRLQHETAVKGVSGVSASFNRGFNRYGYKVNGENKSAFTYCVDPEYLKLLGIELVAGRHFDERIAADSNAVIVNEALVRDMKWEDPLNEYLNWREDTVGLGAKVIGVVNDYHFQSLEQDIEPMMLSMNVKDFGHLQNILVKISPKDIPGSIDKLRKAWNDVSPNFPFEFTFLDQDVANQYSSYERWMNIMGFSTTFAILISCMGLFGLSGVNAVNRTKEIGIRKVMGAQLLNIFVLLNQQYVFLALIAFVIAGPASWYIMQQWLNDFKYSVEIGWELFAISMSAGLMILVATVSYHAIRTALLNPADTLKYE